MNSSRTLTLTFLCLALAGCGAARAVATTGEAFDNFGCLSREFKSEPPCKPPAPAD